MPNWCNNTITITGDKKKISVITHAINSIDDNGKGLFETLVGREPRYTDEEYELKWYDSNIGYWGCKWDIHPDEGNIDFCDESITITCETAWSPPIEFCNNLVTMYKVSVHIFYSEPGIGFTGETNIYLDDQGVLVTDDTEYGYLDGLYILDKDLFWSEVDYYIDSYGDGDEKSVEEYVTEIFPFVTEEDRNEIINQINKYHDGKEIESENE